MKYILHYILTFFVFLAIDFIWLAVISKNLYKDNIGHLMAENVKYIPALIFYLLFVIGILSLSVYPGLKENNLVKTMIFASIFGLVSYGTYDLTNWATLKSWPAKIVIIDMCWGTFLSISVALASYFIGKFLTL